MSCCSQDGPACRQRGPGFPILALILTGAILAPFVVALTRGSKPAADSAAPAHSAVSTIPPRAAPVPAPPQRTPRFGAAEPIPKPPGAVRLATYNVENLFDEKDDPALSGEHDDARETKPAAHREAVAEAIRRIDADVIALQEVESYDALIWFRDAYLADLGYAYAVSLDAGDERGIEQSVLSRFPLSDAKVWPRLELGGVHPEWWGDKPNYEAGKPILLHRSPLQVTVAISPLPPPAGEDSRAAAGEGTLDVPDANSAHYTLTLLIVHHKSGREGTYWREKEAARTVEFVRELQATDADRNIAVLGDFNAVAGDAPMRLYAGAGLITAFSVNSDPLASTPTGSTGGSHDAGADHDPALISHASGRTIDHILLNSAFAREFIPETRFILGTPTRTPEQDWRTTPPPPGYASDHYPVVIDLSPADR